MTQYINLYEPSMRLPREWLTLETCVVVGVAALITSASMIIWTQREVTLLKAKSAQLAALLASNQNELTKSAQKFGAVQPDIGLQADVGLAQATVTSRKAALELLRGGGLGNDVGYSAGLSGLGRQTIQGLWLTGLALDQHDVALRGRALSPDLIPAFVKRLNTEAALQGRSFRALDIVRPFEDKSEAAGAPQRAVSGQPQHAAFVEFSLVSSQGLSAQPKEVAK